MILVKLNVLRLVVSTSFSIMRSVTRFTMLVGPWYVLRLWETRPLAFASCSSVRVPVTISGRVWGTESYIPPIRQYSVTSK